MSLHGPTVPGPTGPTVPFTLTSYVPHGPTVLALLSLALLSLFTLTSYVPWPYCPWPYCPYSP